MASRLLSFAVVLGGCVHARDLRAPGERLTDDTAYTLQAQELRVDAGLGGVDFDELGPDLSLSGGVTRWLELGANVGHAALGVLSLRGKATAFEHRFAAIGVETAILWTKPSAVWLIPRAQRRSFEDTFVVVVPSRLHVSLPLHDRVGIHFAPGYTHAFLTGRYEDAVLLADGGVGVRDVFIEPQLVVKLGGGILWITRLHLSLWASAYQETRAEYDLSPGIRVGGVAYGWQRVPFSATSRYQTSIEARLASRTYLRVSALAGAFIPQLPFTVVPSIEFYWRFALGEKPS